MGLALITGGASIIGVGIAKVLIEDGWRVVLADINEASLAEARKELGGTTQASDLLLDVTQLPKVKDAVRELEARHGAIDALVTAAGGQEGLRGKDGAPGRGPERRRFLEMDPREWSIIMDANVQGVMNACYAVLPAMVAARNGAVVCIASGAGLRARAEAAVYSAAKAGVIKFVQAVAQELAATGVRMNCVLPGTTDARWRGSDYVSVRPSPMGVETDARDVGNAVAFLLSSRASHITGSCIDTSGGATLH